MGGPSASVLLPRSLNDQDHAAIRELIVAMSRQDLGNHPLGPDAFWVCDTHPAGGRYLGSGRSFAVNCGSPSHFDVAELARIETGFGFAPAAEVTVSAFCNDDEDHRILGEFCTRLAEKLGGIVDFNGALLPPIPVGRLVVDFVDLEWRQVETDFLRMIAGLPGLLLGISYEPQPGREWVHHIGDVAFLKAWLGHPNFRMVK